MHCVLQVATKDVGIAKDGSVKDTFARGVELVGRQTLFAEGCRGSCSEELIERFSLREGKDEQSYGLGIKEVWEVPADKVKPGYIQHTLGWPLQKSLTSDVFGGTFLYHMAPNHILVGMVVGLDYPNPYMSPYKEFQVHILSYHLSLFRRQRLCILYMAAAVGNDFLFYFICHYQHWKLLACCSNGSTIQ